MSEFSDITVIKSTGPGDVLWDKSRAAGTAEEHAERLAAEVGHAHGQSTLALDPFQPLCLILLMFRNYGNCATQEGCHMI